MIFSAGGRASIVDTAVLDALVTPFLADKVGQCQGVLGHVRLQAVAADAAIVKGSLYHHRSLDIMAIQDNGGHHTGSQVFW